ncbi:hypothetical protein SBV1_2890005 [Verrucomicrobia bacterium]|nr:hypothetical protein SBV1_2890005 [Verrucomicrobiota bacterium]
MTEAEVVHLLSEHFESLFPKVCPKCNRCFNTLREYVLATRRIGSPISYDAELGDWNPTQPIGSVVAANCPCGTTLALSTDTMPIPQRLELLNWIRMETQRRGFNSSELLNHLREEVRKQVSVKPGPL